MREETEEEFMDRILDRVPEPEDLYGELERALVTTDGKTVLRHRFVVADPYKPKFNAHYNQQATDREERAEKLRAAKQWWDYVDAHEKHFWPTVLVEIKDIAPQPEWVQAVRTAWYLSDTLWINRDTWMRIFADRTHLAGITTPEEAAHRDRQSSPLTVFRGCHNHAAAINGMSWSLDYDAAAHFAQKLLPRGIVVQGTLKKEHVIVYLSPNDEEHEVIVAPGHVTDIETVG